MRNHSLLLLPLALILGACGPNHEATDAPELPSIRVEVVKVAKTPIPVVRELPGTVRPRDHAIVGARVMGLVTRADFTVGQPVREGDVIVELAAAEIDARVEQARTALEQSRLDHEREAALLERGASTRERVREMDERRRIAESAFAEAQTLQGYTHVAAPFGGRITRRYVNSGDLATPGAPLFGMEDSSVLRVECEVPESLPELPLGAEVAVRLESETVQTRVVESSPAADPLSRTRLVKLELAPESGARSGQFARVLWPDATIEGVAVPREALSRFGQMERVFVVSSGRAQLRLVRTGMELDGCVQIISGLSDREVVVLDPPASLRDGQPVEVAP